MTLRSGADYLASLRDSRDIWLHGHKVPDVTTEPGLVRGARTLADLLDRQASHEWREVLSFEEENGIERSRKICRHPLTARLIAGKDPDNHLSYECVADARPNT